MKTHALSLGIIAALAGCSSLSGYDAKTSFACQAPDGVLCESMSGIYANAMQRNLPGQRTRPHTAWSTLAALSPARNSPFPPPLTSGTPIRRAPRVLRVWFAPWEDSDGDLHDQSVLYLTVDDGEWLIEHNQRRIEDAYRPAPESLPPSVAPSDSSTTLQDEEPSEHTAQTGIGEEQIDIGVRQDRPRDEQARDTLEGIVQPGVPPSEAP
jgi:conjugal transfer pilus assembly protein TraV